MAGDITFISGTDTYKVTGIDGIAIGSGTPSNGNFLVYSSTGTANWAEEITPTATGQMIYWTGGSTPYWTVTNTPSAGYVLEFSGGVPTWVPGSGSSVVSNASYSNSAGTVSVSTTPTNLIQVSGINPATIYTNYQINLHFGQSSNASVADTVVVSIYDENLLTLGSPTLIGTFSVGQCTTTGRVGYGLTTTYTQTTSTATSFLAKVYTSTSATVNVNYITMSVIAIA
jgi:hypothetical protein